MLNLLYCVVVGNLKGIVLDRRLVVYDILKCSLISIPEFKLLSGLGFNIVGGTDSQHLPGNNWIFVSQIKPNGPAARDQRIREGDRIVSVSKLDV